MILVFVDSKWRDTRASVNISNKLERHGIPCLLTSYDNWQEAVKLKPSIVVLNHPLGERNKEIIRQCKTHGGKVVIMPTEGRPNDSNLASWLYSESDYDVWFDWNNSYHRLLSDEQKEKHVLTGCARFDAYSMGQHKRKEELFGLYGIDSYSVALIASSFPQSKFAKTHSQFNDRDWKDLNRGNNANEVAQRELELFKMFMDTVSILVSKHKGVHFIVKPHPMEPSWMWEDFCERNENTTLITQSSIEDIVPNVDVVVNRLGCITTYDAWLGGCKHIISTHFDSHVLPMSRMFVELATEIPVAYTPEDLLSLFHADADYSIQSDQMDQVIENHLGETGVATDNIVKELVSLYNNHEQERSLVFDNVLSFQRKRNETNSRNAYPNPDSLHTGKIATDGYIQSLRIDSQ